MTIGAAHQQLLSQLNSRYGSGEAVAIADLVMENITRLGRSERIVQQHVALSASAEQLLGQYTLQLRSGRPVQYVLQEAWFGDLCFFVNENVLIPRPETEELVAWVIEEVRLKEQVNPLMPGAGVDIDERRDPPLPEAGTDEQSNLRMPGIENDGRRDLQVRGSGTDGRPHLQILDIGTGSGCIAVALKKAVPAASLCGCDISGEALEVAAKNAREQHTDVAFFRMDMLDAAGWDGKRRFDIIVSNPPYIPLTKKQEMDAHVLDYEPHLALFVADEDPLLFYRQIARFARLHLNPSGQVYVEIHANSGAAVASIFEDEGFVNTVVRKDMQGKERFVRAGREEF